MSQSHRSYCRTGSTPLGPVASTLLLLAGVLLAGCNRPAENVMVAAPTNAPKPAADLAAAPVLSEEDTALFKAAAPASEADKAWSALQKNLQPPTYPPEWQDAQPSKAQIAEFEKKSSV